MDEVPQTGWHQSAPSGGSYTVTLALEQTLENLDFGNYQLASVRGQKFHDHDRSGFQSSFDEPGLNGWAIRLLAADGTVVASGITHDDDLNSNGTIDPQFERGRYELEDVPPGTYTLEEVLQPGWQATAPPSGAYTVTLESGKTIFRVFGNVGGDIHGQKFHDVNLNGVRDTGEVGLDGWTIRLVDASGTVVTSALTDDLDLNGDGSIDDETERGLYWFFDVLPWLYTVEEVLQTGWAPTAPSSGSQSVELLSSPVVEDVDFGNVRLGSIHGQKFLDPDANGVNDDLGAVGLNGWTIRLLDSTGTVVATQVTDDHELDFSFGIDPATERGLYWFEDVPPGTYTVDEVPQTGWHQSAPSGGSYTVTLALEQTIENLDFGNYQLASVRGQKFHDHDRSGFQSSLDEPGLNGWTIRLLAADGTLARIHRWTGMDGVRTAEGGEGVTGAMIRARFG